MATGQYIGVNGVARKVVSPYVGVDGVARNVKNGYVGVDGVARLFFAPESGEPVVLEVEKITSNTYANETTYENEEFILLDIYPKTGGTVNVTYGGLTKTITDTSGAEEPNAQLVFFGVFNGVSDSVVTPSSGTLIIEGDCRSFASGTYVQTSKNLTSYAGCVVEVVDFGKIVEVAKSMLHNCDKLTAIRFPDGVPTIGTNACNDCDILQSVIIPASVTQIGDTSFFSCDALTDFIIHATTPPTLGGTNVFSTQPTITVPKGCAAAYKAADGWSAYANYIVEAI